MVYPLAGLLIGALLGGLGARRRKGTGSDRASRAPMAAIIGTIVGLFVFILLQRSAG